MTANLNGKRIVLTGASRGVGYESTKLFLKAGAHVIGTARDALRGQVAVNALDPGWLRTDLGGPNAPGEPADGARRTLEVCALPWEETGKFWHASQGIDY